jgi:hypothetical protein
MGTHTQVSLSLDIAFGHLAQYMSWHMNELTTCLPACSCFLNFTPTCAFPDFRVGINSARVMEASRFGWVLIIDYVGLCIVYQSDCFSFLSPFLYRRLVRDRLENSKQEALSLVEVWGLLRISNPVIPIQALHRTVAASQMSRAFSSAPL